MKSTIQVKFLMQACLMATLGLMGCSEQTATVTDTAPAASTSTTQTDAAPVVTTPAVVDTVKKQLTGSKQQYTQTEIDNYYGAPDWFPDQHSPMPKLVSNGDGGKVMACASCHLASGLGHPESANLAGLPVNYLVRQMQEYRSRTRFEPSPMYMMAGAMSDAQILEVSQWFAALKPVQSSQVKEVDTVPKTAIHPTLQMRQVVEGGGTEPINGRLIEVPADAERVAMRDPRMGFIAYVPRGSIALGKTLVTTGGGKTVMCASCHGADLKGTAEIPRLAGLSPDYIVRQLTQFKNAQRHGAQAPLMLPAVGQMTPQDMIAVGAYLGSLKP